MCACFVWGWGELDLLHYAQFVPCFEAIVKIEGEFWVKNEMVSMGRLLEGEMAGILG